MFSPWDRLVGWLGQGQNAGAIQAISAAVTAISTVVLVSVTARYTKLMGDSINLTREQFAMNRAPRIRLTVRPSTQSRKVVVARIDNLSGDDVRILGTRVEWRPPPDAKDSLNHRRFDDGNFSVRWDEIVGEMIAPNGYLEGQLNLPSNRVTAQYLDISFEDAQRYLSVVTRCAFLVGADTYEFSFSHLSGYSARVVRR